MSALKNPERVGKKPTPMRWPNCSYAAPTSNGHNSGTTNSHNNELHPSAAALDELAKQAQELGIGILNSLAFPLRSTVNIAKTMKSHKLVLDSNAKSASDTEPAFIARPEGAPVYHGFPVLEDSLTDGWRYGAITTFEGVKKEEEGDGFVIAPDGSRAGIVWSLCGPDFKEIVPPDEGRWGVYAVRFPNAVSSKEDLIENFRAVLPLIKAQYQRVKNRLAETPVKTMTKETGRILVAIGLSLQVTVLAGAIYMVAVILDAFEAIGHAGDIASAAAIITAEVASSLWLLTYTAPLGLVGLVLLATGIIRGAAREPWVFWLGMAAMVPWLLIIPIGTLIGLIGVILFLSKKRLFEV